MGLNAGKYPFSIGPPPETFFKIRLPDRSATLIGELILELCKSFKYVLCPLSQNYIACSVPSFGVSMKLHTFYVEFLCKIKGLENIKMEMLRYPQGEFVENI